MKVNDLVKQISQQRRGTVVSVNDRRALVRFNQPTQCVLPVAIEDLTVINRRS
jgi:hypothetical protein